MMTITDLRQSSYMHLLQAQGKVKPITSGKALKEIGNMNAVQANVMKIQWQNISNHQSVE